MDCETWFLKTLHTSDQWTLWKSFVGFRGRIEVDFAILFTSKENFPRPWQCGAARADQRWPRAGRPEVAPAGFSGSGQRDVHVTPDVGNRCTTERDFGFVPIRGGGRLAELYAEPTAAGAAASERRTAAHSCGLCWLGLYDNIAGRHLCRYYLFGNSSAKSLFRVLSYHWQLKRVRASV